MDTEIVDFDEECAPQRQAILYLDDVPDVETGVPTNGWTSENYQTVLTWKTSLIKTSFIYQYLVDSYRRKLNVILVLLLFFNTFSTLLSAVTTTTQTVDKPAYKLTSFVISIVILTVSAIVLFLSGLLKIYKFDDIFMSYSGYVDAVDHMYAVVDSQLSLPTEQRDDAIVFIKDNGKVYEKIIQQSPNISISNYDSAMKQYEKFLTTGHDGLNYRLSHKIRSLG